jgi:segregation and condensation protein A
MQQQILTLLFEQDEVTWRDVLLNLVKTNQIDAWDVDIRLLTKEYMKLIKKLKALDFRVSGKVILAAALLLRIKSEKLLEEDIMNFDSLMQSVDEQEIADFYDEMEQGAISENNDYDDVPKLIPRTPQLKKRRVSIYDLIEALEEVLETPIQRKVVLRDSKASITLPEIKVDISRLIDSMSEALQKIFLKKKKVAFSDLIKGNSKEEKVYTFMPLLHLANMDHRIVDLAQEKNFSEIYISPANNE